LDVEGQFGLEGAKGSLNPFSNALTIVASARMDLHFTLTLQLHSCLLHPLSVQFLQVFPRSRWRILPIGIFQWSKLFLSEGLEQTYLVSLFKNIEVEEFKLNSIIFLRGVNFVFLRVPMFDLLLSEMVLFIDAKHDGRIVGEMFNE